MSPPWPWRRRRARPRAPLPRVGDAIDLEVLGTGRVSALVERVAELRPEGVRGIAWRVTLRLPDGDAVHAIKFGEARLCFIDPRHRVAR